MTLVCDVKLASTLPYPLTLTFFLSTLPRCSLSIGRVRLVEMFHPQLNSQSGILSTSSSSESLHYPLPIAIRSISDQGWEQQQHKSMDRDINIRKATDNKNT